MIGVKLAAVVLAFAGNWAAASCGGGQEPSLGFDQGKVQPPIQHCSSHWTDPNWTWDCGKYKEPGPVATTLPKTYPQPKARGPNVGGQNPNVRAKDRALQEYCNVMPNSPDCK